MDRPAILSLCSNRLFYTKYCFHSLYNNAGMEFDHYVVDNGSTDGTDEWLYRNRKMFKKLYRNDKNLGIRDGFLCALNDIENDGHEWFITTPNDLEILTDNIIVHMNKFWNHTKGKYLFGPKVFGIAAQIPIIETKKLHGYNISIIGPTGGGYCAYPIKIFKEYINSVEMWRATGMCKYAENNGIKNVYLNDLHITHFDTNIVDHEKLKNQKKGMGQLKRYPKYMPVVNNRRKGYIR